MYWKRAAEIQNSLQRVLRNVWKGTAEILEASLFFLQTVKMLKCMDNKRT